MEIRNSKSNVSKSQYEGEQDGEGESYSSSCSCSSCLRDRNADNGLSLKLSQYSYRPTYGEFLKNEDESQVLNMSAIKDDETQSVNNNQMSTQNMDSTVKVDYSNTISNNTGVIGEKQMDFPDNLNNGRFTMQSNK